MFPQNTIDIQTDRLLNRHLVCSNCRGTEGIKQPFDWPSDGEIWKGFGVTSPHRPYVAMYSTQMPHKQWFTYSHKPTLRLGFKLLLLASTFSPVSARGSEKYISITGTLQPYEPRSTYLQQISFHGLLLTYKFSNVNESTLNFLVFWLYFIK